MLSDAQGVYGVLMYSLLGIPEDKIPPQLHTEEHFCAQTGTGKLGSSQPFPVQFQNSHAMQ